MNYTVKGAWTPTIKEALKVLLCAVFRIEMKLEQSTNKIIHRGSGE